MAATIEECGLGRRVDGRSAERQYYVKGAANEADARGSFFAVVGDPGAEGKIVPNVVDAKPIVPLECKFEEIDPIGGVYLVAASYKSPDGGGGSYQMAGSFSISFDISGQTQHITQSISTVARYPDNRNYHGAICVDEDGSIAGTDIAAPAMCFTLNYTVAPGDIDDAYVSDISDVVGKINSSAFMGFEAGELLLTRVAGNRRDGDNWDIAFGFAVSKNKTGFTVGDISVEAKRGWDFLWVSYQTVEDEDLNILKKVPVQVNIEQVYEEISYDLLGLPSPPPESES